MPKPSTTLFKPAEATIVRITDKGKVLELEYHGALTEHQSSLWWGTAVGFRAMQVAAQALSKDRLWEREPLYIVSGHPGPGVLDSINYVTTCVERDRCKVMRDPNCETKCNSSMRFEWWVSDGKQTAEVKLRDGFVPRAFYDLADRLFTDDEREDDQRLFDIFKVNLSTRIWNAPLKDNFSVTFCAPLEVGELPQDEWNMEPA